MKLLSIAGVCIFSLIVTPPRTNAQLTHIGQEKCELEKLPLYRVLTVVEQTIKNMCMDVSSQEGDATAKDVLAIAHVDVNQALALVISSVSAINNNVLYEYGDIRDRFMAMATCVGDFDTMPEPYIIRQLRRVIINFDQYLTIFIATRTAFLSSCAKNTLDNMSSLNQLLIKQVLNDDHFSWGVLDYLDDYLVSRPLEFTQEHPVVVSSVALVIIAGVIYCYWEKAPLEQKDDINGERVPSAQEQKKKKSVQEIHEEIKPIFEEIYKKVVEKKETYVSKKELDDILEKYNR